MGIGQERLDSGTLAILEIPDECGALFIGQQGHGSDDGLDVVCPIIQGTFQQGLHVKLANDESGCQLCEDYRQDDDQDRTAQ